MSRSIIIRLALLLILSLLSACEDDVVTTKIKRTVSGVEGFDLIFDDSGLSIESGLFEIGYAIKANYGFFTYRGKLYRSVGGGSVLISPTTNSPAKFIIRETAKSKDDNANVKTSYLQILDKVTGEELARRDLESFAIEDGTGWTGDHAIKFVRKVLYSQQSPERPWSVLDYQPAKAEVTVIKSTNPKLPSYPEQMTPQNCPEDLRIESRPGRSELLRGESFDFLPSSPIRFVACDSGLILVASGVYSEDLNLDLLTLNGKFISQGYVHLPLQLKDFWASMLKVALTKESTKLALLVNQRLDANSPMLSSSEVLVYTKLNCMNSQCTSEDAN